MGVNKSILVAQQGRKTSSKTRPDLLQNAIAVEGVPQLMNLLRQLPKGYDRKFLHKLIRFGAKPIMKEAKRRVPVDRGLMQKSIKIWPMTKSDRVGMLLGVRRGRPDTKENTAYYASMVEYGTWKQEPQPFMRPAWDSQANNARKLILDNAERKFELEVKRLTKKGVL